MKKGIISLGEALIDFIPMDQENIVYQKCPGGAPANVAVGLAKLGAESMFLGKVGEDVLGRFLVDTLASYGVDPSAISLTKEVRTGAVFVTLAENGERSFDFYINPSADQFLQESEIRFDFFADKKILHFGSISLINEPAKSATKRAVNTAKDMGMLISYDPNLRLNLWKDEETAKRTIISMLPKVDVLKVSEEELEFLTGERDMATGISNLKSFNIPLVIVTLGENGSILAFGNETITVPAMKVQAVDTTGAGDAYVSGILYCLNDFTEDISKLSMEQIQYMAKFASIAGGLAASTKGAMSGLPDLKIVTEYLSRTDNKELQG
ncbi:aminoimidazole riboside kinase [Sutcliffiella halmapala]|uniref:aminoimidazole riboside kinase n=1 Tax=Sutcliffiella halmapala TaxID=79882 RepID=UPI000994D66A|nr:aminoimidazole riboside kinase [Sutcliffiella halmapala]